MERTRISVQIDGVTIWLEVERAEVLDCEDMAEPPATLHIWLPDEDLTTQLAVHVPDKREVHVEDIFTLAKES